MPDEAVLVPLVDDELPVLPDDELVDDEELDEVVVEELPPELEAGGLTGEKLLLPVPKPMFEAHRAHRPSRYRYCPCW